ncbi:MAG: M42 family metallopeptidase [Lachnospiraceae bacterium]
MNTAKSNLKELLRNLHDTMGVSGNEEEVIKFVYEQISPYADEVNVSTTGNIVAVKKGSRPGPKLLLGAHLDEIGFLVKGILPNGFILIEKVGGVPDNIMLGRKVLVSSKRIPGVMGTKPGHLQTPEEARMVLPISKCYVDVGLSSDEEVRSQGIKIGDPVIFKSDFMEMTNPDIIATRAIDNRINCALIIELFKNLKAEDFGGEVYGVFTVREELGLKGAPNAIHGLGIDYAIALDTVPAGDTPDIDAIRQLPIYLGKGPGFPIADGLPPAMVQIVHPGVRRIIEKHAAAENINLQQCTILGYAYATDASAFSYSEGGIPTATLTVPRRYSHSPVEMMNINDAVDLLTLITVIVKDNENADLSFVKLT